MEEEMEEVGGEGDGEEGVSRGRMEEKDGGGGEGGWRRRRRSK